MPRIAPLVLSCAAALGVASFGMRLPTTLCAQLASQVGTAGGAKPMPEVGRPFDSFVRLKAIATRWDDRFFYIESNGMPDHPMMIGITAWQQQVPIPQRYVGDNAWRVPLNPVPAKDPKTTKGQFLRGAIAIAANGIPIFNPLNNRGDDSLLAGELDEFGGHCGRADDYHYHIAPVHLQKIVGKALPVAYALDGYPIYGYEEPDGSPVKGLDAFNGHADAQGRYHYHATKTYPYLNGGFHGEVVERDGQVDPQPRANPIRPALPPLRGAKIVGFIATKPGSSYRLTYEVNGKPATVSYTVGPDGSAKFDFTDPRGATTSETYAPGRRGGGGGGGGGPGANEPRPRGGPGDGPAPQPAPRDSERQPARPPREVDGASAKSSPREKASGLSVTSTSVSAQGRIDVDCTCDGARQSPALEWTRGPSGTVCYAVSLWHTAPDQEKSYWVLYNIPADTTKLPKNAHGIGTGGRNDWRSPEYEPMCSKGPGVKTYHLTVYALAAQPKLAPDQATRANLLAAIKNLTLAEGTLDFQYERSGSK